MHAPAVVIISYDNEFYEKLSYLAPHYDAKSGYEGKEKKIKFAGEFNSALQGAYFIMAARSIGLDCCPMLGFSKEKLNQEFSWGKKNLLLFAQLDMGMNPNFMTELQGLTLMRLAVSYNFFKFLPIFWIASILRNIIIKKSNHYY